MKTLQKILNKHVHVEGRKQQRASGPHHLGKYSIFQVETQAHQSQTHHTRKQKTLISKQ